MARKSNVTFFLKLTVLVSLAVALSLELFAKGITMKFALQGGRAEYNKYSYFSHMVYGYFPVPMIAGIMTAAALLLSVLGIIFKKNKRIYGGACICNVVAIIGAVLSMTAGNPVSVCVTILLVISCLCLLGVRKKISEIPTNL